MRLYIHMLDKIGVFNNGLHINVQYREKSIDIIK